MKTETIDTSIQILKNLQHEVTAWEGRLNVIKMESESLAKKRDVLKTEVEAIQLRSNQDVEKRHMESRAAAAKVQEARVKLESDKKEFEGILLELQKEKNAFGREKQAALDMKTDAKKSLEQVGTFIRMVRDGATKL